MLQFYLWARVVWENHRKTCISTRERGSIVLPGKAFAKQSTGILGSCASGRGDTHTCKNEWLLGVRRHQSRLKTYHEHVNNGAAWITCTHNEDSQLTPQLANSAGWADSKSCLCRRPTVPRDRTWNEPCNVQPFRLKAQVEEHPRHVATSTPKKYTEDWKRGSQNFQIRRSY